MLAKVPEFWERQPFETPTQWDSFKVYRDLPLHHEDIEQRRTIKNVARIQGRKVTSNVSEWCTNNSWVERAVAYDDFIGRSALKLKVASLGEYQRHVIGAETIRFAALEELIDKKIRYMIDAVNEGRKDYYDEESDTFVKVDSLEIQRVVKATKDLSDLQHRVAKLPTNYINEVSEDQSDDAPFVITGN